MNEMDISPQHFEEACQLAEGILSAKLHQSLFEQIWAASDFNTFKRMMIQLNIDLQLHALEVLASKYGMVPDSFLFDGMSKEQFEKEDRFFKEAVRRSLAEIEPSPTFQNVVEVHQIPESLQEHDKDTKIVVQESGSVAYTKESINVVEREVSAHNFVKRIWGKAVGSGSVKDDSISVDDIKNRQEYLRSVQIPLNTD